VKNYLYEALAIISFGVVAYFTSSTTLEIVAALSGLVCVYLNAKENIWAYPVGFVNAGCFFYMFWDVKLYADAILQVMFGVLMVFGWYIWLTKRQGNAVRPTIKAPSFVFAIWIIIIFALGGVWGAILHTFTDASVPYLDATVAMASIVAQLLLSRKVLQNWILWIAIDIVSIGLYWYKGLHLTAYLYAFFLLIAIQGYLEWRRNYEARVTAR
jgi:nicotinamide mononucleotide transporter